jgi:mannosyl-oligosaccharide alpha-1,2-mannosidase
VLPRRWWFFAFAAIASVLVLYQTYSLPAFEQYPVPGATYTPPAKPEQGRFHWSNRPIHYPPGHLTPLPSGRVKRLPAVQHEFGAESTEEKRVRLERRQYVQQTFSKCWSSYKRLAWMRDELSPISGRGRDTFGGWAATLVDALDTLWIMDMKQEF